MVNCPQILKKWKVKELRLWKYTDNIRSKKEPKIIIFLKEINFSSWAIINVKSNGIESFQELSKIRMPIIQEL